MKRKKSPAHALTEAQKQQAKKLASRFSRNAVKGKSGMNMNYVKEAYYYQIWGYVRVWLDQHQELPTGVQIVPYDIIYREPGRPPAPLRTSGTLLVDFDKLQTDPKYPLTGRDNYHYVG